MDAGYCKVYLAPKSEKGQRSNGKTEGEWRWYSNWEPSIEAKSVESGNEDRPDYYIVKCVTIPKDGGTNI